MEVKGEPEGGNVLRKRGGRLQRPSTVPHLQHLPVQAVSIGKPERAAPVSGEPLATETNKTKGKPVYAARRCSMGWTAGATIGVPGLVW